MVDPNVQDEEVQVSVEPAPVEPAEVEPDKTYLQQVVSGAKEKLQGEPLTLPVREDAGEGVVLPDVTQKASEKQMGPAFSAQGKTFLGEASRDQTDEALLRTQQQDDLIARSKGFYMLPENPQDVNDDNIMENSMYVEFPLQDQDINYKKRVMFRNGAGYLRAVDEAGNFVTDAEGRYAFVPLTTTEELEGYTTPYEYGEGKWTQDVGEAVRDVKSFIMGPGGKGDMAAINEKFLKLGMTNPVARTVALRGIATGQWTGDVVLKQLRDLKVFAASAPQVMPKLAKFLTVDVAMNVGQSIMAEEGTKAYQAWEVDKETLAKRFDKASDALDIAKTLGILNGIEMASDGKYDPQIMEEILAPRGFLQTLAAYTGPELAMVGPWAVVRTATAASRNARFASYLRREYGTDDLVKATDMAFEQAKRVAKETGGEFNPPDIIKNYLNTYNSGRFQTFRRNRAKNDIDIVMGLRAALPGETRTAFLKQEIKSLDDQLDRAQQSLANARKLGRTDDIKTYTKAVKNLTKQRDKVQHGVLVPKYYKDLFGESRLTVGAQASLITLFAQYLGDTPDQEDLIWFELAGAGVTMLNPTGSKFGAQRLWGESKHAASDLFRFLTTRVDTLGNPQGWKEALAEWNGSRKARKALQKLAEQPSQFQMAFVNGLRQTSELRQRMMDVAARTNTDIDPDLLITNLATMSGIAELMDISRQLDTRITATGLDQIAPAIMDKQNATNGMLMLVNQLADTAAKLTDLKLKGNLADDDPISIMASSLTRVVSNQKALLNEERQIIEEMVATNREGLEALLEVDLTSGVNSADTLDLVQKMFDLENKINVSNLNADVKTAIGAQQQELIQVHVKRIKEARARQLATIEHVANGLNYAEAASGRASQLYGTISAFNRSYYDSEAARMYTQFDLSNPDAYANVSQQFDEIMGSDLPLDDMIGDIGDAAIEQGIAKLTKGELIPKDRRAFALLFDGAAANGFARIRKEFDTDEAWGTWLAARGVDTDGTQLEQFLELRGIAQRASRGDEAALKQLGEENGVAFTAETAKDLAEQLPMLINVGDWRKINSYLGRARRKASDVARKDGGSGYATYSRFHKSWQNVGKSTLENGEPNPSALKVGWDGEPTDVAEEVMADFNKIQEWYQQNIVQRYYTDKSVRQLDSELAGPTKQMFVNKEGEQLVDLSDIDDDQFIQAMQESMSRTDAPNMPTYWLDNLIGNGKLNQVLDGERLYQGITRPLAKMGGGVYDGGQYKFLVGSVDEMDEVAVKSAQQMKVVLTRHLQGRVARMLGDQMMPRDANGKLLFKELDKELKYDKELVQSMLNIPVYERNAAGQVVRATDEYGNPRYLLDENEVWDSVSLNALERNRLDLQDTFNEAEKVVAKQQDMIDNELNLFDVDGKGNRIPVGASAQLKYEQEYAENLIENLFRLKGKEISGGELIFPQKNPRTGKIVADVNDAKIRQFVFERFVQSGDSQDSLRRLRDMMQDAGENPEHVDYFIKMMVRDHVLANTQRYAGKKQIITPDKVHIEMAEMEISAKNIFEIIGRKGTVERENLDRILGTDATDTLELIAETIRRVDPEGAKSGIEAYSPSMSLDSVLSRLYNINRGVVSVQWVATESIIRSAKMHQNTLLRVMLQDHNAAREVLRIIETGEIPAYRVQPDWLRLLLREATISESREEASMAATKSLGSLAGMGNIEYAGIDPYYSEAPAESPERTPTPQPLSEIDIERKTLGIAPAAYQQQVQQRKQGTLQ